MPLQGKMNGLCDGSSRPRQFRNRRLDAWKEWRLCQEAGLRAPMHLGRVHQEWMAQVHGPRVAGSECFRSGAILEKRGTSSRSVSPTSPAGAKALDFGPRGWLAIDPKRVVGERGFDYANLLCNPDLPTTTDPARLLRQSRVIAQAAGLERQRLLQWTLAFAGLSAVWFLEDSDAKGAAHDFGVAGITLQALKGEGAA